MEEYLKYVTYVIIAIGIIRVIKGYYVKKSNNVVQGITVEVLHSRSRKGSQFSYPKVEVISDGISRFVNCLSIKKSNYDKDIGSNIDQYSIGEIIPMYQYRNFLQKEKFSPVSKFFLYSFKTLTLGITIFIISLFM